MTPEEADLRNELDLALADLEDAEARVAEVREALEELGSDYD